MEQDQIALFTEYLQFDRQRVRLINTVHLDLVTHTHSPPQSELLYAFTVMLRTSIAT